VAINHRSAVTFLTWVTQTFPPAALTGVLAVTSVCFDLSIFELFTPLLVGGTVVLAEPAHITRVYNLYGRRAFGAGRHRP
jgi:non-ribosomal peptide synthetase component F